MRRVILAVFVVLGFSHAPSAAKQAETNAASPYARWTNGPPTDSNFFPVAVWLQNPSKAERYKAAGINVYVGLYRGPTAEQLAQLEKAGMRVICGQRRGLEHKDDRTIIGWMHNDEPDNAQSLGQGQGYGPPILPAAIAADYEKMRTADPSRPILLNLGQGVAWDNYIGRGVRRNHPEDYPAYVKGCDIASFDIYPVVHDSPVIQGNLEFVGRGVERLIEWTDGQKVVWNCIECSRISNTEVKPTAEQIRAEVWMSLIQGSRGLIYFVHQFKPVFKEASLLDDRELLEGITAINRQIRALAPVLNSPTLRDAVSLTSSSSETAIALMAKRHGNATYIFAVNMGKRSVRSTFQIRDLQPNVGADVLGESRTIAFAEGKFTDDFDAYAAHLYRIQPQ